MAGLDEDPADNLLRAAVLADLERHADLRRATSRIFGSRPGSYGAGLLPLMDSRSWRDDADLAEVYAMWGGHAYGRGLDGRAARDDMEAAYRRIAVAVKNTDTREHDIADSDDYYQYHGGMVATVRALTGTAPAAYVGDSTRPEHVRTRSLTQESARVFRSRVVNPRWIEAMQRHGYKGAFELAATVDYLFGYDATTGVVTDWMYEQLSASYVLDPQTRKFLETSNPWALRVDHRAAARGGRPGAVGRASRRTRWTQLRDAYLEVEGQLEEGSMTAAAVLGGGRAGRRAAGAAARRGRPRPRRRAADRGEGHGQDDPGPGADRHPAGPQRRGQVPVLLRPGRARPGCPDGPHPPGAAAEHRPARLVELPLGATDDRVTGSLDVPRVLAGAPTAEAFVPGLLAQAHRGVLYVDEINLLPDHLVDVMLDAAATGTTTVEREGISLRHASRFLLVGTMNPEEGELRPQLLDRFGLCVPVVASADPRRRADAVRARLRHDRDPAVSTGGARRGRSRADQPHRRGSRAGGRGRAGRRELLRITRACAALGVDGLRGDLVTARAAIAHAAWAGRSTVTVADVKAAARLALPHRRRRGPFDDPGLDDAQLDEAFGSADDPEPTGPDGSDQMARGRTAPGRTAPGRTLGAGRLGADGSPDSAPPEALAAIGGPTVIGDPATLRRPDVLASRISHRPQKACLPSSLAALRGHVRERAGSGASASPRARSRRGRRSACGTWRRPGSAGPRGGRRSRSQGPGGRPAGAVADPGRPDLTATVRAAALARPGQPFQVTAADLRRWRRRGRESNLVILLLDTSGSMAARRRSATVTAVALSLLRDSYRRRDRVALLTFRGREATVVVPPTRSVELASRRLSRLPVGGQTPLAAGLDAVAELIRREHWREPARRPLLVVVTDGRATGGRDALDRARQSARRLAGVSSVVVDAEEGPVRLGLAGADRPATSAPSWPPWPAWPPPAPAAGTTPPTCWPPSSAPRRPPDAAGSGHRGARRRADHPAAPHPAAAGRAHRRRQGQVHRRLRPGPARLGGRLAHRRVPVHQEPQVEGRRGDRAARARHRAPEHRRGRQRHLAQDGRGLVLAAYPARRP